MGQYLKVLGSDHEPHGHKKDNQHYSGLGCPVLLLSRLTLAYAFLTDSVSSFCRVYWCANIHEESPVKHPDQGEHNVRRDAPIPYTSHEWTFQCRIPFSVYIHARMDMCAGACKQSSPMR